MAMVKSILKNFDSKFYIEIYDIILAPACFYEIFTMKYFSL